jgi:hypothetical protein
MKSRQMKNHLMLSLGCTLALMVTGCSSTAHSGHRPAQNAWLPGVTIGQPSPSSPANHFSHPAPWHSAKGRMPLEKITVWHVPVF